MRVPLRSSGPSKVGGVGCAASMCTTSPPTNTGTSQKFLEERRNTSSSSGEYQSAGSGVAGSSGRRAPGMSFHRKVWKVRTSSYRIGYLESTAIPYWPGNTPKPSASSP